MKEKAYIAIDLKSFYASVECMERHLDPLKTNLVVADPSRTEKTICLAVSPSLKSYGIPGRARLFEVVERVKEINRERVRKAPGNRFTSASCDNTEIASDPAVKLDYIVAPPQMARYIEISSRIYEIYMKYIAPWDIHVYSIDEVFIDATPYLNTYGMTARELAMTMIRDVLSVTGITATAGIGTNLYLAKIAMDIEAKHIPADSDGVRIAELDEETYRRKLWTHQPITDFWRVGKGIARRLAENGMFTMGDVALCSEGSRDSFHNEDLLYRLFGVNAELLIDHAWGWEPCGISDIREYRPETHSLSRGQVLSEGYPFEKGRLIAKEMTDLLTLELVEKRLVCDQIILTVGYDVSNLSHASVRRKYKGEITADPYGRAVPKPAHGSINLGEETSSTARIMEKTMELYDRIVNRDLLVRRMVVAANHTNPESERRSKETAVQLDMFTDAESLRKEEEAEKKTRETERKEQIALIAIRKKFGKNAIVKGMNLEEGATSIERNGQIGGHRAYKEKKNEGSQ